MSVSGTDASPETLIDGTGGDKTPQLAMRSRGLSGQIHTNVRKVAVALGDVEAVAHHQLGLDMEPDIGELEVRPRLNASLDEQRADGEALRTAGEKTLAQVREGEAAVEDVLDDEDMTPGEVDVEGLQDPDRKSV